VGQPLAVGLIGCGNIAAQYLTTLDTATQARVVAAADLDPARARTVHADRRWIRACTVEELLADPHLDAVLNLTVPAAHAEVTRAALDAGKHVYVEKPLAATRAEAEAVLRATAGVAGLRVAAAPDTVLGTGVQTARHAVDRGALGVPVAATAFMVCPGHEGWHPDPEFYYRPGGGPLLDMGPYYLTALVHLLGPVSRVAGAAARGRATRTIGSGPRAGTVFDVEVPTHVTGVLEHAGGAITTLLMSFDVHGSALPHLEVYGTEAALSVPDPNTFGGEVRLRARGTDWRPLPPSAGYPQAGRGIGLVDLADALAADRPHRASLELAYHVLDVMHTLLAAAGAHTWLDVASTCPRPTLVPLTMH
jgi:predicted dehydrogenase